MKNTVCPALAISVIVLLAPHLPAQTCLGLPSASVASRNLTLAAAFPARASTYDARLGAVRQNGAFAGVSVSYLTLDDQEESGVSIAVDVGGQLRAAPDANVRVCPVARAGVSIGPDFNMHGTQADIDTRFVSAGAAVGTTFEVDPSLSLVPFASLALAHLQERYRSERESYTTYFIRGLFAAGLGFSVNDRVMLRFTVSSPFEFPFGLYDAAYGLGVSVPLGRR